MLKKLLLLFCFLILPFIFTSKTYGATNFDTSYNVVYDVNADQTTRVTLNIGLKNKTTDYYASSYAVQTGFDNISNIYVADSTGPLNYKTVKNDKGTEISFDFKDKTVGLGNTEKFSISFTTPEISKNFGTVWEVNIPGISNQSEYAAFNVEVKTPGNIGSPSIIKPAIGDLRSENNSIFFTKNDLGNGGISVAYGPFQTYKFNLKYNIENKNLFPETTEIAIPSDNSYQTVAIDSIDPKPIDVVIDPDGNWLARYKLLPSQKQTITVKGRSKISYLPKPEELSIQQKNIYLKSDKYWEINDPQIQKLAKELKTPGAIYDYVTNTLKYDDRRIKEVQTRLGAKGVLANKASAVCLEFTDLFVTLARAAGIPARAVEGYANTNNSADRPLSLVEDVLHAWPEYYDTNKKTWVMVDPTWANTTKGIDYFNVLDFDHFAFVVKGEDSDYPVPAGGYKFSKQKDEKSVFVTTIGSFEESKPSLNVTTDFARKFFGGIGISGNLILANDSGVITPAQTFKITSDSLMPKAQNFYVAKIPPYGKRIVPVKFSALPLLTNKTYVVKIAIGNDVIEKKIIVEPFYKNNDFLFFVGVILIAIFLLTLSYLIYRSRRLHFPK